MYMLINAQVGISNLVSGLLGGYTGSYIFSQTILNMRGKVANRVSGTVIFILEMVLVFGCPVPPTAFVRQRRGPFSTTARHC